MKILVCHPLKALASLSVPSSSEVLAVEHLHEALHYQHTYHPNAIVLFSEAIQSPVWEWVPRLRELFPQETRKVILPLHRDRDLIVEIVAASDIPNVIVLESGLSLQEVRAKLTKLFGDGSREEIFIHPNENRKGNVILFSSLGGTGVTTHCINFSAVLARQNPGNSVAVVDLNLTKPDLTSFFHLHKHHLAFHRPSIVCPKEEQRFDMMATFQKVKGIANLYAASAATAWKTYEVPNLIRFLRTRFDFVLLDYGSIYQHHELLLSFLSKCDEHHLLLKGDPFSVRRASEWIKKYGEKRCPMKIILTQTKEEHAALDTLKEHLVGTIPSLQSSRLFESLQQNSILVEEFFVPKAYMQSLRQLANKFLVRKGVPSS